MRTSTQHALELRDCCISALRTALLDPQPGPDGRTADASIIGIRRGARLRLLALQPDLSEPVDITPAVVGALGLPHPRTGPSHILLDRGEDSAAIVASLARTLRAPIRYWSL